MRICKSVSLFLWLPPFPPPYFTSQDSKILLECLNIKNDFLSKEPETLPDDEGFKVGITVVGRLQVVNDTAERAIALNTKITKSDEQRQHLLLVVEGHQWSQPWTWKEGLMSISRQK